MSKTAPAALALFVDRGETMEPQLWIVIVILLIVLVGTFVHELHLRGELNRERIKNSMLEQKANQLAVAVNNLAAHRKKHDINAMLERDLK